MNFAKLRDSFVVGIQNRDARRRQLFDQFAFGPRNAFDGIREKLDVRVSHVRHHSYLRTRDFGQCADLSGMVHSHLQDGHLASRPATAESRAGRRCGY